MPRNNPAVLTPEPNDDQEIRSILLKAQRLLSKGESAEALRCLKGGAEAALASANDKGALKLAAAAAELRTTRERGSAGRESAPVVIATGARAKSSRPAAPARRDGPPPLPKTMPNEPGPDTGTVDVDVGWLVSADGAASEHGDSASVASQKASLGEAVRVWVGPSGDLLLFAPATHPPKGYVEALLVTHVPTAGLARRLRGH